jgi:hypothetical protein
MKGGSSNSRLACESLEAGFPSSPSLAKLFDSSGNTGAASVVLHTLLFITYTFTSGLPLLTSPFPQQLKVALALLRLFPSRL